MNNKKVLVLGSDYGTIDMVYEAKRMGLYVITTDLMDTSPTKEASDEAWKISTTDLDLLETRCKENHIVGILTGASDFNINCARKLCKRLKLPIYCESDKAWEISTNKSKFKKLCKEVGAPIADDYYLTKELKEDDLDKIIFPVVVKPVDKSGNRGMSYCNNKEELKKAYKNALEVSDNETIIVERQLHGPEWTVNYILADGEINLFYFSREHHQPGELANLYSLMNTSSGHLKQYIEEVNDKVIELLKKGEFRDGIAWVEVMLDEDGHFYLIESGYRYGGDMTYASYEKVCGFNAIRWMIEIAIGIKHTNNDLPKPLDSAFESCAAAYYLFSTKDDEIFEVNGLEDILKISNTIVDMPKREGSRAKYHAAMGVIRTYGENHKILIEKIKMINNKLSIKNKNGENLLLYFTDFESVSNDFEFGLREFNRNYENKK